MFLDDHPGVWASGLKVFDADAAERLARAAVDGVADLDVASALTRLVHRELEGFGTSGSTSLDDDGIALALRSLRAVLRRLGIEFRPPFQDFRSFHDHWKRAGMGGSWGARRDYLRELFSPVLSRLDDMESGPVTARQVDDGDHRITEITRRRLAEGPPPASHYVKEFDGGFHLPDLHWSGDLDEVQFLGRLYDLDLLPSKDIRHATARGDIGQHRVTNHDGEDDWIFSDERFGLADSDTRLLRFLAETLHPAVRTDQWVVEALHSYYNQTLIYDGYEIVQVDEISGSPVFGHRRIGGGVSGDMKNLIFASTGPKPRIVVGDAISNDFVVTRNADKILIYDRPLPRSAALTWADVVSWWRDKEKISESVSDFNVGSKLWWRLAKSVKSPSHLVRRR